jgi:hypothetical protein
MLHLMHMILMDMETEEERSGSEIWLVELAVVCCVHSPLPQVTFRVGLVLFVVHWGGRWLEFCISRLGRNMDSSNSWQQH